MFLRLSSYRIKCFVVKTTQACLSALAFMSLCLLVQQSTIKSKHIQAEPTELPFHLVFSFESKKKGRRKTALSYAVICLPELIIDISKLHASFERKGGGFTVP